jgi:signal transduction histidine kinase
MATTDRDVETSGDARADAAFVLEAIEALDAWLRDPRPGQNTRVRAALDGVVRTTGARGAFIAVDAPPLPALQFGTGTLLRRPADEPTPTWTEAVAPKGPGTARRFDLVREGDHVVLGAIWLDAPRRHAETAARAVGRAVEAAWDRADLRETSAQVEALDAATRAIAGVLDIDLVLQLIVDRVAALADAQYAAIGIVDSLGRIERFIMTGVSREQRERIGEPPHGHGLLGLIIREGRSFRIPEISAHPDSYGFPPNHPPMGSFLGVPVTIKGGSIGNLYLTNKRNSADFSEADQALVERFALHAGIAIENARLHSQVQRLAIVEERDRIARDLHDGVIQSIYGVALSLEDVPDLIEDDRAEAIGRVDRAIDRLNLAIRDIRNFILGLGSETLGGTDLEAALATLADEVGLTTTIDVEVAADDAARIGQELGLGRRIQLLQMAREALSNTARHSRASQGRLSLRQDAGAAVLEISDNGRGFDPQAVPPGHLGLANLRDRAVSMGGSVSIESAPDAGTRIIVRLPIEDSEATAL